MARDYSKYLPEVDSCIVANHRRLAKEKLGMETGNIPDEEIYRLYHENSAFETRRHDEFYFLLSLAEAYGDEDHPYFAGYKETGLIPED